MKIGKDYIGVVVATVILNKNGEVLFSKRSKKVRSQKEKWELPGGIVEFGESREDALKREIKEELGIDIKILKELCIVDGILTDENQHWLGIVFISEFKGKRQPEILEPQKSDEIGWYSLSKLPKPLSFITTQSIRELKKQYRDLI